MKADGAIRWKPQELGDYPISVSLILIALVLLSPANTPFPGRDEGVFMYVGRQILAGKIPYRDVWDHKGPLIYYINAAGLFLSRDSTWGIWLVEAIFLTLSLLIFYGLLRRTLVSGPAVFGMLTWLAGFTIVMGGNIVEEYAILFVTLSLYLVLRRPRFSFWWTGILGGLAFLLRPNEAAAPLVALFFLLKDQPGAKRWRHIALAFLQSGLGFAAVVGAVAAYFALHHALNDLIGGMIVFNYFYVAAGGNMLSSLLSGLAYLIIPVAFAAACLLWIAFAAGPDLSKEQRKLLYFALGLLLATVPLSLLSGRNYRHYYVPWLFPLSILSAYFFFFLQSAQMQIRLRSVLWIAAWCSLITGAVIGVRIRAVPLLAGGGQSAEMQVVESIQAIVPQDKELLIWGNETRYGLIAGRTLASRYVYMIPLLTPGFGNPAAQELLGDIRLTRPIIIDTSPTDPDTPSLNNKNPPYSYLRDLYTFIHENYSVMATLPGNGWIVWEPNR